MNLIDQLIEDLDKKSLKDTEWYVSVAAGVDGPFTEQEFQAYIHENKLTAKTQVWNKSLSDWTQLATLGYAVSEEKITDTIANTKLNPRQVHTNEDLIAEKNLDFWLGNQRAHTPFFTEEPVTKKTERKKLTFAFAAAAATAVAAGIGGGIYFLARAPKLTDFKELTSVQNREIKATRSESLRTGITGSLQMLGASSSFPRFVIASNVKDTQDVTLKLVGVPGTLIGAAKYTAILRLKMAEGVLLTNPLTNSSGAGFPVGEYLVTAVCESCVDHNTGIVRATKLAENKFFIGGEKNFDYDAKLRRYHLELKGQARQELMYFRQMGAGLMAHYEQMRKIRIKPGVGLYDGYNEKLAKNWSENQAQFQLEFQNLAERYKRGEVFYDKLTSEFLNLFAELPEIYNAKIEKANMDEFVRLGLKFRAHHGKLNERRYQLETLPLTANGRPRTE